MNGTNELNKTAQTDRVRFQWLDLIKAAALVWIFINHVAERLFGPPLIANPYAGWPSLAERIAQLAPLAGLGLWTVPGNLARYVGWFGDQGVQLFLIISGFGLTWGLLAKGHTQPLRLWSFYRRRAERVYPLWWAAHLFFVLTWLLVGWGMSITDPALYLSMLGIRTTPGLLYYFAPAWWYIGLLLQLYLVYPLLWRLIHRWGPTRFLIAVCLVGFTSRAIGALLFVDYLDAWLRGAIFLTRIPEFALGMSLALWFRNHPELVNQRLRSPLTLVLAAAAWIVGTILSLTLLGMSVAPFVLGASIFVPLYAFFTSRLFSSGKLLAAGSWIGHHTYSLFIMHHTFIMALVPMTIMASAIRILGGVAAAAVLTVVTALVLERAVEAAIALLRNWVSNAGMVRTGVRLTAIGIVLAGLAAAAEMTIRIVDPQEVLGWGERPSLEPNDDFGWRLKPSQTTRLRWESYDYTVTANSLGFPAPAISESEPSDSYRIMTLGDAFTSAEGVNTDQSWPRLLEQELASELPDRQIEVLNFGVTGYGPNQYSAIVKSFAPQLKPDVIVIGFFVNEYGDVLWSDEDFQNSIGFGLQSQEGLYSIVRLSHFQRFIQLQVKEPLLELLRREPSEHGYFLGNFTYLEREQDIFFEDGRGLVAERLTQIKNVADEIGSEVIIAMIPASIQVCSPEQLAYFPRFVNLGDPSIFDIEQPQQVTKDLAAEIGISYYDLIPALKAVDECPYQPHNMHWTPAGHLAAARFLTEVLTHEMD